MVLETEGNAYRLENCKVCGNTGLQRIGATYRQKWMDYCDGELDMAARCEWTLLECPVCLQVSLLKKYTNDHMIDYEGNEYFDEEIVYPDKKKTFQHTPQDIVNAYEAAVDTLKVDPDVSLIAIRRVLEKICKERGYTKGNLEDKLGNMAKMNILPESLEQPELFMGTKNIKTTVP